MPKADWCPAAVSRSRRNTVLSISGPAGDPFVRAGLSRLAGGGPDQGGVDPVGVVTIGVAPRIDEKWIGSVGATYHRGLGFKVTLGAGRTVELIRAEQICKKSSASRLVIGRPKLAGGIG